MRTYHKSWQNKRPGWTRRVQWYQAESDGIVSIRLVFTDTEEGREIRKYYPSTEAANADYAAFIAGATVESLQAA